MFHLFFEQSGTFKREFAKLGFKAEDYDILNQFNETDHLMDLFEEINKAYDGQPSVFDNIDPKADQIIAFFPCVRFSNQAYMLFQGKASQMQKWTLKQKLEYDIKMHEELNILYTLISKMVIVCCDRNIKLIVENPYSKEHYLTRYWAARASVIDEDRRNMGDYYKKPTQYFFINREPSYNFLFEPLDKKEKKLIHHQTTVDRSMIAPDYANRFIREFVLRAEEFESL